MTKRKEAFRMTKRKCGYRCTNRLILLLLGLTGWWVESIRISKYVYFSLYGFIYTLNTLL